MTGSALKSRLLFFASTLLCMLRLLRPAWHVDLVRLTYISYLCILNICAHWLHIRHNYVISCLQIIYNSYRSYSAYTYDTYASDTCRYWLYCNLRGTNNDWDKNEKTCKGSLHFLLWPLCENLWKLQPPKLVVIWVTCHSMFLVWLVFISRRIRSGPVATNQSI